MMLPALPPLPPRADSSPKLPAIPEIDENEKPPPPKAAVNSFAQVPPPPPPQESTPATVELQPCPTCGARLTVNAEDVGAHVECPMCKTVFEGKAGTGPTVVTPMAPPPPAAADVDIAPCPKCKSELTVSEEDLGKDVECPHCRTVYVAERPKARSGTQLAKTIRRPTAPLPPSSAVDDSKKKPYEFKPKKEKKKDSPYLEDDEEDEDNRPSKRKSKRSRQEDDAEDDRPSRRGRREDDDEDDEDDDRTSRRKKRRSGSLRDNRYRSVAPHDGVLNLVLAIVAFFVNGGGILCCNCLYALPPILAIYVIIKSSMSISEIKKGLMDPGGRVMLEIARALAILAILITIGAIVFNLVFAASIIGNDTGDFGGGDNGGGGRGRFRGGQDDDF